MPHLTDRYVNFRIDGHDIPMSDEYLPPRWYDVGLTAMPTTAPEHIYSCGTKYPLWMSGDIPKQEEGVVLRTACKKTIRGSCSHKYNIKVANCTTKLVYFLIPTSDHSSAYCFGIGKSGTPTTFLFKKPVVVAELRKTVLDGYPVSTTYFKCKFTPSTTEHLLYQVYWTLSNKTFTKSLTKGYAFSADNLTLEEDDFVNHNIKLGVNITCSVRAFTKAFGPPSPSSGDSDPFFAGIKILTPSIDILRGKTGEIHLQATVPIGCVDVCTLNLQAYIPVAVECADGGKPALSGKSSCGITIPASEWNQVQKIKVTTDETGVYKFGDRFQVLLETDISEDDNRLWIGYQLPSININIIQDVATKQWEGKACHAQNDPHMTTFDQKRYEHQPVKNRGEFVLYRHTEFDTEVQHRMEKCNGGSVMCNCGVAVKAGQDVYIVSVCGNHWNIGYKHCGDNSLSVNKINDKTYTISFLYGTSVKLAIQDQPTGWGKAEGDRIIDVQIFPSVHDTNGRSEGLCGTLDDNTLNDFKLRGQAKVDSDRVKFTNSWRVPDNENLFNLAASKLQLEPWAFKICVCDRKPTSSGQLAGDVSCGKNGIETCQKGKLTGQNSCHKAKRTRRAVTSKHRVPYIPKVRMELPVVENHRHRLRRSAEQHLNWTQQMAEDYCKGFMAKTAVYSLCNDVPSTHTDVSMHSCAMDIVPYEYMPRFNIKKINILQLTQSSAWTDISMESMQRGCLGELDRNTTLVENGGSEKVIVERIQEIACLHNCTDIGDCVNGTCVCPPNFGASDCSLNTTKPPRIDGILDGGLCDESSEECSHVYVFGEIFVDSINLTCRLKRYVHTWDNSRIYQELSYISGEQETLIEAICPLHQLRGRRSGIISADDDVFVEEYEVSVSNDGKHFGEDASVYLYDGTCQQNTTQNGTVQFQLLDGFCLISTRCFNNGTFRTNSTTEKCDIERSKRAWSPVVNGGWTDWSSFTTCSKSDGSCKRTRNRSCTTPTPQFGSKQCAGNSTEVQLCNERLCPAAVIVG